MNSREKSLVIIAYYMGVGDIMKNQGLDAEVSALAVAETTKNVLREFGVPRVGLDEVIKYLDEVEHVTAILHKECN